MTDVDVAIDRLRVLADSPKVAEMIAFVHPGTPIPKERARWSPKNNHWYTPNTSSEAQTALEWRFKAALSARETFTDTIAIVVIFVVATRQRKDVDNLMKLVMDAATKAHVWKDDSQVVAQASFLELDREHPRTIIALCPCLNSLTKAPLLMAPERPVA